ncbi:MAG: hypothetical protein K2O18_09910 [Oscillospiraceae bacterium]|nr:hypothetical protein [Oscillospiraceae bacterium]
MFGYVRPSEPRLSGEDKRRFSAAYCGLCRTLGERHGLPARFILNYDFAFLAILLWPSETGPVLRRSCPVHPVHGRDVFLKNPALELAADCSVILTWWQMQDALNDPGKGKGKYRLLSKGTRGAYRRARQYRPGFDRTTQEHLQRLHRLEQSGCATMDEPADAFAQLLAGVSNEVAEPAKRRILEQFLYHLGRWIYLVDAADDLQEDFASGSYNPLIRRFSLENGTLPEDAKETLALSLDHSIRLMSAAFELWDFGVWTPVIQSVVYEGLFLVGRSVLDGTFHTAVRSRPGNGRKEKL